MNALTSPGRWAAANASVQEWLSKADKMSLVQRLWDKDATVWKKEAAAHKDIKSRLGWLTCVPAMRKALPGIAAFADEIRVGGFTHVVLLGMGGSSLAPEVFQNVCGNKEGSPVLVVLDSTDPGRVKDVDAAVDLAKTLFIVSSKSGGTIELLSFFKYFYDRVKSLGIERPGDHFVAITDPGTPLTELAKEKNFRRVFLAPEDVGGRFSALTPFGLVPAAVIGVDVAKVLDSAERMIASCGPNVPAAQNPAAMLGVAMAVLAEEGRDKLTLLADGAFASFGDWAEQLVAESTGKEGVGVIPVVREAAGEPAVYGQDRFFTSYGAAKEAQALAAAGHPVLTLGDGTAESLGGEFFRWEMATAVACALLKVNAFDQPDVQSAKDRTKTLLKTLEAGGQIPLKESQMTLESFFENGEAGDYAAVLAFVPDRPVVRKVLEGVVTDIRNHTRLAVTLGFGPRYLHSTGQLHKGGPKNGIFLLVTAETADDVPVPGEKYTFGQLELAQAMGDFEALETQGRWMYHYRLKGDMKAALETFQKDVAKALAAQAAYEKEMKNY